MYMHMDNICYSVHICVFCVSFYLLNYIIKDFVNGNFYKYYKNKLYNDNTLVFFQLLENHKAECRLLKSL